MVQKKKNRDEGGGDGMMKPEDFIIKVEKKGKLVKSWSFDKADDTLEKSVLEMIDADYDLIRRLRRERGTAEVEV